MTIKHKIIGVVALSLLLVMLTACAAEPTVDPNQKMTEIADRKKAIKYALENAKKDDIILITGLGHEQFKVQNGKKTPWNDAEEVKKLLLEHR
ncbi:MAG: hypothetical protein KBG10_08620 [Anaerolineaceae bacterium]|nr:hypothetical protein [Anaerolineaceae bacterium]